MFRQLSNQLAAGAAGKTPEAPKAIAPTLRSDIYTAIDQAKAWIIGGLGQAGDGVSYGSVLATIQKHFPDTKMGLENMGSAENEVSVVVCGVTNLILEMSRWEGMAGGMAMRTWADALVEVHGRLPAGSRKDGVAKGIIRGISQNTDIGLMTKEFTAKIQIISSLKSGFTAQEAQRQDKPRPY